MKKFLLALTLSIGILSTAAWGQTPDPPSIVTQGVASVKRAPDRGWVSIGVEARESKAADARTKAATQMTTVQTAIKALGIPADAIKTTSFSLQPQVEWNEGKSRLNGYLVRNEISVRIDNIDRVSDVIDAAGSVRTSSTLSVSIAGVRFDLKNADIVEQETLGLAVKDAMARAQAIATGAGRSLGPILRIEEQRQVELPMPKAMYARGLATTVAVDAPTPIEPNEIEVRATVVVTMGIR